MNIQDLSKHNNHLFRFYMLTNQDKIKVLKHIVEVKLEKEQYEDIPIINSLIDKFKVVDVLTEEDILKSNVVYNKIIANHLKENGNTIEL